MVNFESESYILSMCVRKIAPEYIKKENKINLVKFLLKTCYN